MRIESQITFEQYRAALEAMKTPADRRFGTPKWLSVVFIVIFSFSLVILLKLPSTSDDTVTGFIILAVVLFSIHAWCKYRVKSYLRRTYNAQEKQLNGQQMEISEAGISGEWANGDLTYDYKWSAFERCIDLPDAFLFLPNSVSFVRIPKDSLSAEEQQHIRQWGSPGAPSSARPYRT